MELSIKKLLLHNNNWYNYQRYYSDEENGGEIRDSVMDAILQVISCKHYSRGHAQFYCSNKTCSHQKRVPFSCKNRMCNSCGKMQTAKWIEKQKTVLPWGDKNHLKLAD